MSEPHEYYYVTRKKDIMKEFDQLAGTALEVGPRYLSKEAMPQLAETARAEFERMLPELPYVGGDSSPFTKMVIQSGETIAFYSACKRLGLETRRIGELLYAIAEAQVHSVPWFKKWAARRLMFSGRVKEQWRSVMAESQKREYPGNWTGTYVSGNQELYEFGLDFTECGFLKLAERFGCREIAPYVCLADFARMRDIRVGFKRTKTLALGHEKCDFRFVRDYETPRGWPPENLDEHRQTLH